MEKIEFYILASLEEDRFKITESLANIDYLHVVGSSKDIEEAELALERKKIDVMLISPGGEQLKYAYVEKITQKYPLVQVILLEESLKEETLHNALYLGAKDVLVKPYDAEKLLQSINRVQQLAEKRTEELTYAASFRPKKKKPGKILTFFSTKGGVGKTFLAINFATALAERSDKRVVLVDLDLDCGNVSLALNLQPKFTILDVVNDIHNMDNDLIESYLLPHESGLKVLASNVRFDIEDLITSDQVKFILELLQDSFDYVVVDMPGRFQEASMPALALANQLLVVLTPELSTIRNVKSLLGSLEDLHFPASRIKIILNKYARSGEIDVKDVVATLNQKIDETVGMDYKYVVSSLNRGTPIVLEYPKNSISKDLYKLVEKITGEETNKKQGILAGMGKRVRKE